MLDKSVGHDTKLSTFFDLISIQISRPQICAILMSIQINSLIVSDQLIRLTKVSESDYKTQCLVLSQNLQSTFLTSQFLVVRLK